MKDIKREISSLTNIENSPEEFFLYKELQEEKEMMFSKYEEIQGIILLREHQKITNLLS